MTAKRTISGIILTLFISTNLFAQNNLIKRNIICFTPSKANVINGIAFGLWNRPKYQIMQNLNGVNLEILGSGWMTPLLGLDDGGYTKLDIHKINGLSFGLTLLNGKVNGLTISPTINTTFYLNGIKIGLFNLDLNKSNGIQVGLSNINEENNGLIIGFYNTAVKTRGLQIGFVNKTKNLRGLQIGIININETRTLPFINWSSRRK